MTGAQSEDAAHFVPLSVLMSDYKGRLAVYMRTSGSRDVAVTMPVKMDVARTKNQKFFVAVAVTWNFEDAEALQDAAMQECPKGHRCVFAWVPAHWFGKDDFGIYIEDIGVGETLQNGMVAEIIEKAEIEEAVQSLSAI
jgi:hypothetical protein